MAKTVAGPNSSSPMRYALLVRGINVGKDNGLPMAELRAMLEKLGCARVRTYVQSGNAVFETPLGETPLRAEIEQALGRFVGRPIATTLRTGAELKAIAHAHPFSGVAATPANLCVTFLSRAPARSELAPLYARDFAPERFEVSGRQIYSFYPNGQGRSPLAAALAKLPVRGTLTTRNWNTVQKLAQMLRDS